MKKVIDNLMIMLIDASSNLRRENKFKAMDILNNALDYIYALDGGDNVDALRILEIEYEDLCMKIDRDSDILSQFKASMSFYERSMLHSQIISMKDYKVYLGRRIEYLKSKETEEK